MLSNQQKIGPYTLTFHPHRYSQSSVVYKAVDAWCKAEKGVGIKSMTGYTDRTAIRVACLNGEVFDMTTGFACDLRDKFDAK